MQRGPYLWHYFRREYMSHCAQWRHGDPLRCRYLSRDLHESSNQNPQLSLASSETQITYLPVIAFIERNSHISICPSLYWQNIRTFCCIKFEQTNQGNQPTVSSFVTWSPRDIQSKRAVIIRVFGDANNLPSSDCIHRTKLPHINLSKSLLTKYSHVLLHQIWANKPRKSTNGFKFCHVIPTRHPIKTRRYHSRDSRLWRGK